MSALPLISELADKGIRVRHEGSNVVVSPEEALTPDLVERIRDEKPILIKQLEKVRRNVGDNGNDWDEIGSDPNKLKDYYELLMIGEMREKGICPDHYTSTTTCKHCGTVPIWEGCPPEVQNCPWCLNRHRGLPMPNTKTVTFDHD